MTSSVYVTDDDGATVPWQESVAGRGGGKERITLQLSDLVRTSSTLPRLVQIVDSSDGGGDGAVAQGPVSRPGVDLSQPVLLFEDYRAVRVRGRVLHPTGSGELEARGPSVIVPDHYRGWFALVVPGGRSAPCYDSLAEVVAARLTVFLTRHEIPAYVQLRNGVPVKRELDSPGHLVSQSRSGRHTIADQLATVFCRCAVTAGSVLRVLGVYRDVNTTISASAASCSVHAAKFPAKAPEYVRCVNYKNEVLFLPVEVRGLFYAATAGATSRPDWRHICQLSHLLRHRMMPVTVRLVCGHAPRHVDKFTGLMRLESACQQHLVLGCGTTVAPSVASQLSSPATAGAGSSVHGAAFGVADPALFELDAGREGPSKSGQLHLLPLDHRCPLLATAFARALDTCRRHSQLWKRQMRVVYDLYASEKVELRNEVFSSKHYAVSQLRRSIGADFLVSSSGPSSLPQFRPPLEPEVDYEEDETVPRESVSKIDPKSVKLINSPPSFGISKKEHKSPFKRVSCSKSGLSSLDSYDQVPVSSPRLNLGETRNKSSSCLQDRLATQGADNSHMDSVWGDGKISGVSEESSRDQVSLDISTGSSSLLVSPEAGAKTAKVAAAPAGVSPVYLISNKPVRSLSAHNIPIRRRLAQTVSADSEKSGGWRQAVAAFLSSRHARGRRSRGNADVTSSFIFKRPSNTSTSEFSPQKQQQQQMSDCDAGEVGAQQMKSPVFRAESPLTKRLSVTCSPENIYAEIGDARGCQQMTAAMRALSVARDEKPSSPCSDGGRDRRANRSSPGAGDFKPGQHRYLPRAGSYGNGTSDVLAAAGGVMTTVSGSALEDTLKLGSDGRSSCTSSPADTLEQCTR